MVAIETGLGKYLGKFSQPSFHRSPAAGQVRRQINLAAHITVFMNTIKLRITWTMGPCNFFVRGWPTLQTAESACRMTACRNGANCTIPTGTAPFGGAPPNGAFIFNVYHGQGAIPAKNCGDSTLAGPDSAALLTGPAMPPHPVLLRGYPGGVPPK